MIRWCPSCGCQYGDLRWDVGDAHNCGDARISQDRLRELEAAERILLVRAEDGQAA